MKKFSKNKKIISSSIVYAACLFSNSLSIAAPSSITPTMLPSTVLPDTSLSTLAPQPITNPSAKSALPPRKPEPIGGTLGPQAEKIKFKLNKIVLRDNKVYSNAELSAIYKDKIGKTITVAELQGIVQNITNYYRNSGYILSRAVLPPQHVANGLVQIQVIEGSIASVRVQGKPKGAKDLIQRYGDKIAVNKPLKIKTMEHYLLLENEIPGVQVKAVLEPAKSQVGASDLNLVAETKTFNAYISYDNYGTRYIGPLETTIGAGANSIFLPGDTTQATYVVTTRPQELKFGQLSYNMPVGAEGARLLFSGNQASTKPQYVLIPLKINGSASTYYTMLQYPFIRSRTKNLTGDASFNYIDSSVATLQAGIPLYTDHLRTVRTGLSFDVSDSWYGANTLAAHAEGGLNILGATPISQSTSGLTSRYGGSGHFGKVDMQLSRLQQFGATRFSAFFLAKTQYAFEPLLASEQIDFGGASQALGRGYDPAEIIGDRGLVGSAELRMNITPGKMLLQAAQLYVFYDVGVVWNAKNVIDQNKKQSATSIGAGTRFSFTRNISGNLLIAQPLTRQVNSLALINDARQPRVYFSFTAAV